MKTALGKGLGALIQEKEKTSGILELDINAIIPNEHQPRRVFNDNSLRDLASSIKEKGVIQPVIVRKTAENSFVLIAGERRWRAAKTAGLKKIPVIIKDAAPAEALELALIENIQREDLNPVETADAFQRLINEFNLTHDELSKKVGKDRATVTNYLRLLKLHPDIKAWIAGGSLSIGHAKALLQIENAIAQLDAARKIIKKGLSVREAEALSKKSSSPPVSAQKTHTWRDPQIVSLENTLKQSLGTKVRLIHKGKKGGRIEIEYYSLDELDRLLEILNP
ncbi:MAG: ParB/RepB/Spo0J family partition protein [Thermodesulfovibrionia bacterium]|nr:ParB/RepB/Spo0J family partition protein [Thermodesulfovibrionia bacterium]